MPKAKDFRTACAYIRVSTDKQEELSPDAQKRLLLEYAKKNDLNILNEHIFTENGISGKKADKRPEFMRMIGMAKSKEHPFDVILVWKFSRFARNQEESIVYKSLLKKANVEVVSVSEPLIEGPFGSLIERIIEWMDEYYSIRLSGEVMRGMTEKALHGGYQSTLPLGYSMDKSTGIPVINNDINIVKLIYSEFENGMTCIEIARKLNSLGYKTQHGNNYEYRTIKYILENPFYAGKVRWNRQHHETHTIKDKSEWITASGKHKAVFSEEYFEHIQELMIKRSRPYKARITGTRHWLSGMVKCSNCGASLGIKRPNGSYTYFNCLNYTKGSCNESHYITLKNLENAIYEAFRQALNYGSKLQFTLREKYIDEHPVDTVAIIKEQLKRLEWKESRIKAAYMDGIDTLDEYRENKELLMKERKELEDELNKIPDSSDIDYEAQLKKEMLTVYDIITDKNVDDRKKADALRSIVDKIVYDKAKDEIHIFFYLLDPL